MPEGDELLLGLDSRKPSTRMAPSWKAIRNHLPDFESRTGFDRTLITCHSDGNLGDMELSTPDRQASHLPTGKCQRCQTRHHVP